MTEDQWLSCTDPEAMLVFLRESGNATDRKLRLFAVACCRRVWDFLLDGRSCHAVEVSERFADESAWPDELRGAEEAARDAARALGHPPASAAAAAANTGYAGHYHMGLDWRASPSSRASFEAARAVAPSGTPWGEMSQTAEFRAERATQAALLRDILGTPFRLPPDLAPSLLVWNDGLVLKLATAAYEDRLLPSGQLDPACLAVLADALLDAGCTDAELLGHLRSEGPHWRGCWAVDVVMGRE